MVRCRIDYESHLAKTQQHILSWLWSRTWWHALVVQQC